MPALAVSLRIKKFRRRFGITAPRVVVRTHVSWPWYAAGGAGAMQTELESLRLQVRDLDEELLSFRSAAGTDRNPVLLERSTQQRLLDRVRALELENAALKEDMLLFERLIPAAGGEGALRLEHFRVVSDGEQRLRYRLLRSLRSGKQAPEFCGRREFLVIFVLGGKQLVPAWTLAPSRSNPGDAHFTDRLTIRHSDHLHLRPSHRQA